MNRLHTTIFNEEAEKMFYELNVYSDIRMCYNPNALIVQTVLEKCDLIALLENFQGKSIQFCNKQSFPGVNTRLYGFVHQGKGVYIKSNTLVEEGTSTSIKNRYEIEILASIQAQLQANLLYARIRGNDVYLFYKLRTLLTRTVFNATFGSDSIISINCLKYLERVLKGSIILTVTNNWCLSSFLHGRNGIGVIRSDNCCYVSKPNGIYASNTQTVIDNFTNTRMYGDINCLIVRRNCNFENYKGKYILAIDFDLDDTNFKLLKDLNVISYDVVFGSVKLYERIESKFFSLRSIFY